METSGQFHPWGKSAGINWLGGCVGSIVGLNAVEKRSISCPYRESNPGRPASNYVKCKLSKQSSSVISAIFRDNDRLLKKVLFITFVHILP
jgi:hypothetical protein